MFTESGVLHRKHSKIQELKVAAPWDFNKILVLVK